MTTSSPTGLDSITSPLPTMPGRPPARLLNRQIAPGSWHSQPA